MRQLTALDQQFLALEDTRHVGHVGALAVLDPSTAPGGTVNCADLQALIAERLPLVPPFRWRLAEVPFDLDYDYWIDDAEFDLDFHVREPNKLLAAGRHGVGVVLDVLVITCPSAAAANAHQKPRNSARPRLVRACACPYRPACAATAIGRAGATAAAIRGRRVDRTVILGQSPPGRRRVYALFRPRSDARGACSR